MKFTRIACDCQTCQSYCHHTPGWFAPGEAQRAAKYLGLSMRQFFQRYLVVDWWNADDVAPLTFVLRPATTSEQAGQQSPFDRRGACVFLASTGRCQIHAVKPAECGFSHHALTDVAWRRRKNALVRACVASAHQRFIQRLLGRKPQAASGSIFDLLSMVFSSPRGLFDLR